MEKSNLNYAKSTIILVTKHAKSISIAPNFLAHLGASIKEYPFDTDLLGTFTGEIERKGNALECARLKCELAFDKAEENVEYALASEGSFGPDPYIPFVPCDREILYFIDRRRNFDLYVSHISSNTNYNARMVESREEIVLFANSCLFPSHALIVRPNNSESSRIIYKGVNTLAKLEEAFEESKKASRDKKIWVETDMRANMNPTRMSVISETAEKLAVRLASRCPKCLTPGWGIISVKKGLECAACGSGTDLIKSNTFGCVLCSYTEELPPINKNKFADPGMCHSCNP